MSVIIKLRRGLAAEWTLDNPVLRQGEPGVELFTGKFKLGDGIQHWNDLPYFLPEDDIIAAINEAGHLTPAELEDLADQLELVLELPDLVLLWENAKA